jgi:hypothetical protein
MLLGLRLCFAILPLVSVYSTAAMADKAAYDRCVRHCQNNNVHGANVCIVKYCSDKK